MIDWSNSALPTFDKFECQSAFLILTTTSIICHCTALILYHFLVCWLSKVWTKFFIYQQNFLTRAQKRHFKKGSAPQNYYNKHKGAAFSNFSRHFWQLESVVKVLRNFWKFVLKSLIRKIVSKRRLLHQCRQSDVKNVQ